MNNFKKGRVMNYVMDNRDCTRNLMASRFDYFFYFRGVYTCPFGNCRYCGYNKVSSRQKNSITDPLDRHPERLG